MGTHETVKQQRRDRAISGGFSIIELVVLVAVISTVAAIGVPMYVGFQRAQETDGAARVLVTALNQARQLAITRGMSFSVETETANNRLRVCTGLTIPCPGGAVVTGAGTDGSGWRTLENASRIVLGPNLTFTSLGAATGAAIFQVQNASATGTLDVCVSPSGRIRSQAMGSACP